MKFKKFKNAKNIKKIFAISTVIFSSVISLTACGTDKETEITTENENEMVFNLPNKNELSTEMLGTPWKNQSIATGLMFRTLFIYEPDRENISNDLVENYIISEDGLTYEFTLKDNVVWSDGEVLDVDDVIFSIKGLLLAEQFNGIYQSAFGNIVGATDFMNNKNINNDLLGLTSDGNKLIMNLKKPTSNMVLILGQFAILPEHCFVDANIPKIHEDEYWKNPVVSGMYVINEIIPNDYIELVHNEKYIGTKPKIDTILLQANYGIDEDKIVTDLYYTNDVSDILEYRSNFSMKEYEVDSDFYRYLAFNIDKEEEVDPVLSDIRFREAIACAIDKQVLVDDIYFGIGNVIESTSLLPNFPTYAENGITYNPEKAMELLEEMNFDFDRTIKLFYYYTDDISKAFMEALANQLAVVGIKTEIIAPNGISLFIFDDYDICLKGLSTFDTLEWYSEYQSTNGMHINLIGGKSQFDDLIEDFSATIIEEEQLLILQELQELEFNTLYKLPLFTLKQVMYANTDKLLLPEDIEFGNAWYKYDIKFEEWEIKK